MKTRIRLIIGIGLAGCAAVLMMAPRTDTPPAATTERKKQPVIVASPVHRPPAANFKTQPRHADDEPLLPAPVLPAIHTATEPAPSNVPIPAFKVRPPEESMLSSWAARDPEGAGRWLNQNRNHPKFADMVRGYAIQIATTDPAAARQWAAVLNGNGNRFARGGTLEQHIDAIEAMLKGPVAPQTGQQQEVPGLSLLADYYPVLVRQNPDEPPVLEMQPSNPIA
jgi:hypothetical protein